MRRRNKILVFAALVVAIGGLVAVNAAARGDRGIEVRLDEVGRRDLVATVTASGQIEPQKAVDISADITGRIIEIPFEEGDTVRPGDLLIRIDQSQYNAAVARARAATSSAQASALQARANRDQAKRALDRTLELWRTDSNLVSAEQLEQAETSYQVSALQEAQEQLAKTVIRSPMAGQVTRLAVEVGEVAVPGTFSRETGLLMTVSDLSIIQLKVNVDETDVVRVHNGDSADVTIDAFPDTSFIGRVTKISQSAIRLATRSSGSTDQAVDYDVEITLDNPPTEVRPDLSATAKIVTATRDSSVSIPIIALTVREHTPIQLETGGELGVDTIATKEDTEGVFVVSEGTAQFRPVKVGIAGEEYFEVLEGLSLGDTIVAGPYQTIRDLKDGTKVREAKSSDSEERAG
jgi:HlyD family secretion protein